MPRNVGGAGKKEMGYAWAYPPCNGGLSTAGAGKTSGHFSLWHWMVVVLVVLPLFGGGKVSGLMGDFARGIKAHGFLEGMSTWDWVLVVLATVLLVLILATVGSRGRHGW